MRTRGGLALIVVVGVLGVLAVLAVAFVTMAQLERKASQQRVNAAKAYLLARSGVEDALSRLALGQDPVYAGENWDGSSDGMLSGYEATQEVYHRTGMGTAADLSACPGRQAMRPSFFVQGATGPATLGVEGRERGYSGLLTGDRGQLGNHYALKLVGGAGFFLNGGDPTAASDLGYNAVLRRVLGTLCEAIDRNDHPFGLSDGLPVTEPDGWKLIDLRPSSGWESFEQVRDLALGGSQAKLEALREYLTLSAWVDRSVIAPNATAAMVDKDYHSWGEIRLDRPVGPSGTHAPDFERIGGRVVGRAPVDFAWARTKRPALIALMSGLKGLYLDETTQTVCNGSLLGTLRAAEVANTWSLGDDCHVAAFCFQTWTSPIATWSQFNAFCEALPLSGTTDIRQAKRDLLKANFNPNADLNKFNPTLTLWKAVDKSDLLAYSTEFSLFPVQGREVESTGRVLSRNGRLLACRTLRASVAPPSVVRLSTQRDFVCQDLGDPTVSGDETGVRLPGQASFLSLSQGLGRTWGHTLPGLSPSGVSLQTYPEPCVDPGSGLSLSPADYDGNLQLATVETAQDAWYGASAATRDMKMLARFDEGFDLDVADADPASQPQDQLVTTAELGNGLMHAFKPNSLYPDGAYSEVGNSPTWKNLGNEHGYHGVMSFWVKPAYTIVSWPADNLGHGIPYVMQTKSGGDEQFFFVGDTINGWPSNNSLYMQFEINQDANDIKMEHGFRNSARPTPRVWNLVTAFWDFRSPTEDDAGQVLLNQGLVASWGSYTSGANDWTSASDITGELLVLGRNSSWAYSFVMGDGANATFDEFALYDFGGASGGSPAPAATLASPGVLAQNRYKEGRFYKGAVYNVPNAAPVPDEAAFYLTPPIRLPKGGVLRSAHWTWYRPPGFPPESYAEIELLEPSSPLPLDFDGARFRSSQGPGWTAGRQSWKMDRLLSKPFRARVVFRGKTPSDPNVPLLDSPVFDDLTFLYEPPGGPGISGWEDLGGG